MCVCVLAHQLLFQVWRTSGSLICLLSACSSRKSNMYLMARGSALPRWAVLNTVSNKSSTNFCSVPWPCSKQQTVRILCSAQHVHHTSISASAIMRSSAIVIVALSAASQLRLLRALRKTHCSHIMQLSSASWNEYSQYAINTAARCTQFKAFMSF